MSMGHLDFVAYQKGDDPDTDLPLEEDLDDDFSDEVDLDEDTEEALDSEDSTELGTIFEYEVEESEEDNDFSGSNY